VKLIHGKDFGRVIIDFATREKKSIINGSIAFTNRWDYLYVER
jgi:hypothetical protein